VLSAAFSFFSSTLAASSAPHLQHTQHTTAQHAFNQQAHTEQGSQAPQLSQCGVKALAPHLQHTCSTQHTKHIMIGHITAQHATAKQALSKQGSTQGRSTDPPPLLAAWSWPPP
jgi:hypothetical protein